MIRDLPASVRQRLLDNARLTGRVTAVIKEVCSLEVQPDGLAFDLESVSGAAIKKMQTILVFVSPFWSRFKMHAFRCR
jgi:hypothetical protein